MILIDSLKVVRKHNYILKFNQNFKNYKYMLFCDNPSLNLNLVKQEILFNSKVKYIFLKKFKCIKNLTYMNKNLKNSTVIFCTNDLQTLYWMISKLKTNILFCKIDNNYYSLKNLNIYINSIYELINYLDQYMSNFIFLFQKINK